jgi:hypothetical protein
MQRSGSVTFRISCGGCLVSRDMIVSAKLWRSTESYLDCHRSAAQGGARNSGMSQDPGQTESCPGRSLKKGSQVIRTPSGVCSFQISESSSYRRRRQINSCSDGIHKKLVGLTIGLDRSYGVEDGTQGSIAQEAQRRYDWGKLRGLYPMPGSCENREKPSRARTRAYDVPISGGGVSGGQKVACLSRKQKNEGTVQ